MCIFARKIRQFPNVLSGMIGGIVGSLIILAGLYYFFFYQNTAFIKNANCSTILAYTFCIYDTKLDSSDYLAIVTSFYGTVITILVTLLTLVVAFAYVIIRNQAYKYAEDIIKEEIGRYFETHKADEHLKKVFAANLVNRQEFSDLSSKYEELVRRMDDLDDNPGTITRNEENS